MSGIGEYSKSNRLQTRIRKSQILRVVVAVSLFWAFQALAQATTVTRGPYLQIGTPTSVIVRWRTDAASDSRVRYGTSLGSLTSSADNSVFTTEHEVAVSGLTAETTYYYSIGTSTQTLVGDDATYFFETAPTTGTSTTTRVWVLGDSGTANSSAQAVRNAYFNFAGATHTNLWLMLGDNAYDSGTDTEYQAAVFNMYPTMLRKAVLWPTIGNHDTAQSTNPPLTIPYFNIFTLPTNAEAGGMNSGTEKYYSFDYGNIHFICLDSMTSSRSSIGSMANWLRSDLASTTQQWIIAFWHHPPYSKGSHDSDSETELKEMRENILPILEDYGVDLVLSGHSHSYERSFLIDAHYGLSTSFNDTMKKDGGDGREDGTGAYQKASVGPSPHEGAVYAVAGSSGQTSGGTLNHPAMFISLNSLGSMVLDINGNRLDAKFLRDNGTTPDHFTVIKGSTSPNPPTDPTSLTALTVSSSQINLSWTDNADNESGFKIEQSTDGTFTNPTITIVGANVTTYSATGLSAATTYYYRVRAYNSAGDSGYSNTASATTSSGPPADPSNLTATAVSKTQINLSWADNSSNEDGFKIEQCRVPPCKSFSQIAQVGPGITTYSNTGLRQNTTYRYRVRAFNVNGNSGYSDTASAKTFK